MTMILAAHLGEYILIASDRRAMACDLQTGKMQISHDNEIKIKLWHKGAIAGSGEKVFLDRVTKHFEKAEDPPTQLNLIHTIYNELQIRINEGIPKDCLMNNSVIFSLFNGTETYLYSIQIDQFFQTFIENGNEVIQPKINIIEPSDVDVACFNIPPDMSILQNFQQNLKSRNEFKNDMQYMLHYVNELKKVFAHQASIDPSVTSSFDVYFQSCSTGEGIALYIENHLQDKPTTQIPNYWDRF